jgi:hypothetical protein
MVLAHETDYGVLFAMGPHGTGVGIRLEDEVVLRP